MEENIISKNNHKKSQEQTLKRNLGKQYIIGNGCLQMRCSQEAIDGLCTFWTT